jgi:hypothetical protein
MNGQRCAFAVLSAAEHAQAWGDGQPDTVTNAVTASLIWPNWSPPMGGPLDSYSVSVSGYQCVWRVVSARPGRDWTVDQLVR